MQIGEVIGTPFRRPSVVLGALLAAALSVGALELIAACAKDEVKYSPDVPYDATIIGDPLPGDGGADAEASVPSVDATLACLYQDAKPEPVCEAGTAIQPTSTYTNWFLPDNPSGYSNIEWTLNIDHEIPDDGVYWATQFGYIGTGVGTSYMGMQAHGSPIAGTTRPKLVIFAVGSGAFNAEFGDVQPPLASKAADFDLHPGWNIHIVYEWVACRDYRLKVAKMGTDMAGNIWLGAWIKDTVTGIDTFVGKILIAASAQALGTYNIINFSERFGPAPITSCADEEHTSAIFGTMSTRTDAGALLKATRFDTSFFNPSNCPNARFTQLPVGVRQEMGVPIP